MSEEQPNPARLIYQEAKGAHETSQQLLPLLTLLDESEGSGALDEIKALLSTIVVILGQHSQALSEIRIGVGHAGVNPTA